MNKVFIGLIAFLVVVSGGLAFWSSGLNGKINTLNDDTLAFKADTSSQFSVTNSSIAGVGSELSSFKTDTTNKFTGVESDITSLDTNLSNFKTSTTNQLNTVQSSIAGLDTDLTSLTAQYDESTMNVRRVYDDVIGSVCRIVGDISSGSGFIYGEDGYIVTCWHVVDGQSYLDVILHDGTCKRATVVGSDRYSDVAVIKISGVSNLQPLPLADSGTLVVGEPVIVVGNPLGIFETVTYGVVSRTRYYDTFPGENWRITNLIQFDAPANPGNSGGPVFNKEGQVIGIASWVYTYRDMSYAVSSNKIKRVAEAIINHGFFTNATLPGEWTIDDLTAEEALQMGLDNIFGVKFYSATNVGQVQANDVVIAVDGTEVRDKADLFSYIAEFKSVGDTITLTVIRNGVEAEADVILEEGWIFSL